MNMKLIAFVLHFDNIGKRTFTRELLDLEDNSEVEWIAKQYLVTNAAQGCFKVEAYRLPKQPIATAT